MIKKHIACIKDIPRRVWLTVIICLASQLISYYVPTILGITATYDFSLEIDAHIPLVPAFVYVYVLAFPFWVLSYVLIAYDGAYAAKRLCAADMLGKIVCLICFIAIPSSLTQPTAEQISGVGAWALKIVYFLDEPTKLLPSMHCFVSYLCVRPYFCSIRRDIKPWLRLAASIFALLICLSTVFTKQHVVLDVITGVLLGELSWLLAGSIVKNSAAKC